MYEYWFSWLISGTMFDDSVAYFDPYLSLMIEVSHD